MSNTAFLAVTQYVEALLRQAPALAAGDIERSKERRMALESQAALRIYPLNADGRAAAVRGGFHAFTFDLAVECLARAPLEGAGAGDAEAAADALLQAVWARLAAATPPAGVHSLLNRPRLTWSPGDGEVPVIVATFIFSVDLSAHNQTLALWS